MWKCKTQPYLHSSRHGCSARSIPELPGAMHGWFVRISPGTGKRDGPAPHGWDPWRWDCLWVAILPLPVFRQPPPWSAASGVHVPTLTFASQCQAGQFLLGRWGDLRRAELGTWPHAGDTRPGRNHLPCYLGVVRLGVSMQGPRSLHPLQSTSCCHTCKDLNIVFSHCCTTEEKTSI